LRRVCSLLNAKKVVAWAAFFVSVIKNFDFSLAKMLDKA